MTKIEPTLHHAKIISQPLVRNFSTGGGHGPGDYAYRSNTPAIGSARSCTQQELKWGFENLMDELAELAGLDPVEFRLRNVAAPGDRLDPAVTGTSR